MPLKRQKKVNGLDVRFGGVGPACVTPVSHFRAVDMGAADPAYLGRRCCFAPIRVHSPAAIPFAGALPAGPD
jgi:hypothetical protein